MNKDLLLPLLLKYHGAGARYTCYPSPKFWKEKITIDSWKSSVLSNYNPDEGIDLYIHIPFCEGLCSFCGCNIKVTKDNEQHKSYIEAVISEWNIYLDMIPDIKISSIYIGGGTPNIVSSKHFNTLLEKLSNNFTKRTTGTIEFDPRSVNDALLKTIRNYQFNKLIIGVQDFNPEITKNVNRHQYPKESLVLVEQARKIGIDEICLEFIFGLPLQTSKSIQESFATNIKIIDPEQLIIYPLANAPWQEKTRQGLGDFTLPTISDKYKLMLSFDNETTQLGYEYIGMNNYTNSRSSLNNTRFRNITGFKPSPAKQLISLGNSAISYSGEMYSQNNKVVDAYIGMISKRNTIPIFNSHKNSSAEKAFFSMLNSLITSSSSSFDNIENQNEIKSRLAPFINDNLVVLTDTNIEITKLGRYFIKSICQAIDPLSYINVGTKT